MDRARHHLAVRGRVASEFIGDELPIVWGTDNEFGSSEDADATASALIGQYNWVARTLAFEPEHYGPVLEVDERTEEVFCKPWIGGFARAMRLRPGA